MARRTTILSSLVGLAQNPYVQSAVVGLAVGFVWYFVSMHEDNVRRAERSKQWEQADTAFRQMQFTDAIDDYEALKLGPKDTPPAAESSDAFEQELLLAMQSFCRRCEAADRAVTQGDADAARKLEALRDERAAFDGLQSRWPAPETGAPSKNASAPSGLAFSPEARWNEGLLGLEQSIARQLGPSNASPPLDAKLEAKLNAAEAAVRFLGAAGRPQSVLTTRLNETRESADFRSREQQALAAMKKAGETLSSADLLAAREGWRQLAERHPQRIQTKLFDAFQLQTRSDLLEKLRREIDAPGVPPLADAVAPTPRPWNEQSAFSFQSLTSARRTSEESEMAFVRTGELCFGLNALTGERKWVVNVGFEDLGVPQLLPTVTGHLLLCWRGDAGDGVCVASIGDLKPLWAKSLPPGARLAGPPVLAGRSIALLSDQGHFWQIDPASGQETGRLRIPESPAAPLAARIDGQAAVVVGRDLGVYLLECGAKLSLKAMGERSPNADVVSCRALWAPPYVLLFENLLDESCRIRVSLDSGDGLTEVQQQELKGRLWETPALNGALLLCVTDLGGEHVFGLHANAARRPLYEVLNRTNDPARESLRHQSWTATHAEAPFLVAQGAMIRKCSYQTVARDGDTRAVAWQTELADPDSVPLQPLQTTSRSVIAAFGHADGSGAGVVSVNLKSGTPEWSIELRGVASEWRTPPSDGPSDYVLVRTTGDRWFRVSLSSGEPLCRPMSGVTGGAQADWIADGYSLVWAEKDPPRIRRVSLEGNEQFNDPLRAAVASPIAGRQKEVVCLTASDATPVKMPGPWAAWVDVSQRLHVLNLTRGGGYVRYLQLPEDAPTEGWHRPLWIDESHLVATHPAGHVVSAALRAEGDLYYAELVRNIDAGSGFASPPLRIGESLWLATTDGRCLAIDAGTLSTTAAVPLSARAVTPLASLQSEKDSRFAVGLANGRVAIVSAGATPAVVAEIEIGKSVAHLSADAAKGRLIATDGRGKVFEIDADGAIHRTATLPVAESAAPLPWARSVLVPLQNGGLARLWNDAEPKPAGEQRP